MNGSKNKNWMTPAIVSELSIKDTLAKAMQDMNDGNDKTVGGTGIS